MHVRNHMCSVRTSVLTRATWTAPPPRRPLRETSRPLSLWHAQPSDQPSEMSALAAISLSQPAAQSAARGVRGGTTSHSRVSGAGSRLDVQLSSNRQQLQQLKLRSARRGCSAVAGVRAVASPASPEGNVRSGLESGRSERSRTTWDVLGLGQAMVSRPTPLAWPPPGPVGSRSRGAGPPERETLAHGCMIADCTGSRARSTPVGASLTLSRGKCGACQRSCAAV